MKAIFSKCYDDWGNLKDNALNIAYNLGKKEGLRKGKKIARAEVIEECIEKLYEVTPQTVDEKLDMVFVNALRELKEQK